MVSNVVVDEICEIIRIEDQKQYCYHLTYYVSSFSKLDRFLTERYKPAFKPNHCGCHQSKLLSDTENETCVRIANRATCIVNKSKIDT